MKKLKRTAAVVTAALVLALCLAAATACGGYSLDEGKYTGTYKCHFTQEYTITTTGPSGGTTTATGHHWGAVVTFEVDADNTIWSLEVTAPEPDAASDNGEYVTYVNTGMSNVFLNQFGGWTPGEIMAIEVTVNDSGYPTAIDGNGKNITVSAGQTGTCGTVILAMQDAIENKTTTA